MKRFLLLTTVVVFSSNMMVSFAQEPLPSQVSGLMGGDNTPSPNPFPPMPQGMAPVSNVQEVSNVNTPVSTQTNQPAGQNIASTPVNVPVGNTPVTTPVSAPVVAQQVPSSNLKFPGISESTPTQVVKKNNGRVDPTQAAFEQALKSASPLSPDMVKTFRELDENINRASTENIGAPVKIRSRSISMSLSPGEQPPDVRLSPGMATALTFSDITGSEWPILSVTVGDDTKYKAVQAGLTGKTNMVVITPLTASGESNLVITLVGHPVPIIMMLKTGHGETDGRIDVSIRGRGPNYKYDMSEGSTLQATDDSTVQDFVDGLPPKGAHKMTTTSSDVEVWKYKGMLYIRTPLNVLSPAYIGFRRNISGENIYKMVDAPVILAEQDGRMQSITINH